MNDQFTERQRSYEEVIHSISELARRFLEERETYGKMRTDIKKRMAVTRLYIVNDLPEFLTNPKVVMHLSVARKNKTKLTLDSIDALIALELADDYARYESAKFNAMTSEKAFPMFQAELSGLQSQIKKDLLEKENVDYAQRMTAQRDR